MRKILDCLTMLAVFCAGAAEPRIFRDRVRPEWLASGDAFWYRVQTGPEAWEYVWVDAAAGTREPAFDHARLATNLAGKTGGTVLPQKLALSNLRYQDTNTFEFSYNRRSWTYSRSTGELMESPGPTNAIVAGSSTTLESSRRTGEETQLTVVNQTDARLNLFWLDSEGTPRPYGVIEPGGSRDQHTFAGHVWSARTDSGRELSRIEAQEGAIIWEVTAESRPPGRAERRRRSPGSDGSPDGKWKVEVRNHNLFIVPADGGQSVALTTNGTAEYAYSAAVRWAPDSRKLIAFGMPQIEERKIYLIESSPLDQVQPKLHTVNYPKPGDALAVARPHLFHIPELRQIPLTNTLFSEPWSLTDFRWGAASDRFTFLYNARGHQTLRVVAVDAMTGASTALVDETSPTFIDYAGKLFSRYLEKTEEIIWMSERDGWNHLWLYDARLGKVKNQITRGEWVVREVEHVDAERRQVWFWAGGVVQGQDPYYLHLGRVNFDGTGLRILTEGDGSHAAQFSPDRRYFVDTWSRVEAAPVNELRRAEDGKLMCGLEQADISRLEASGWRSPTRYVAPGRDGRTMIYGIIHWPLDYDTNKNYPVIESIYAGPHGAFVPKTFRATYSHNSLTARGFIVVQVDGMGTSHRSKAFQDVCWKNIADSGFPDRIRWLQSAAREHPAMDLTRVGIYGTSAGGQSALRALIAHGDFYRAAVADSGCHDNRMDKIWWNELWMGWPVGPHYAEQSNVTQAGKMQGQLLLLAGELDRNVDPATTMQVADALIKAGKDFEFLLVPGKGHGVLGVPYVRERMHRFFATHLQKPGKL